ncbi:MAG: V-type ATP synthase subunit F [Gammaproteobacteria bacterium]|nr:V-type ATP synthase subunit F [Gammaproteobacteria bacterium]MBT8106332.1 V-type ATP synthase subunit F [Gammaproteobacteria bacterium]NNK26347.1 Vacuolar H+transporting two-sector ATPase F subunit [Woeseiaceae bacterium]
MAAVTFIGDEVTAQGFRLAGAETRVPKDDDVATAFADALRDSGLVLITADVAGHLDPDDLDLAVRGAAPLVLVVPDAAMRTLPPDPAEIVEQVLGIAP